MEPGKAAEIDRNFQAFRRLLPTILASHSGEYALLRDMMIIGYFDSASKAVGYAEERYEDGLYSVQKVTDQVADLGFFSHVEHRWDWDA